MRVLGVVRLSRETDESTSPVRQREVITKWAEMGGHVIVGWAEDVDVSASVAPERRPGLGPWLRGERGPFDALVAWRVDRIARKTLHLAQLAERHRIVSVSESVDTGTPTGKVLAGILGTLGEAEREAIRQRTRESFAHLARVGRWKGGFEPFGYRAERQPGGGWRLVIDEDAAEVVRGIVRDVLAGKSVNSIAARLNAAGVPTSLDWQRRRAGRELTGAKWRMGNLLKLLRSETLRGYMVLDGGGVVTDDTGRRVRRAEAVLDDDTWRRLQAELDRRAGQPWERARSNGALLLRVAFCPCGERLYQTMGRSGAYYRCASRAISGAACGHPESGSTRAAWLDEYVSTWFLDRFGRLEVVRQVFIPGENTDAERAEIEEALARLVRRWEKMPDGPAADAVAVRMAEHQRHLAELDARPVAADRWVTESLGVTYGQMWAASDTEGRRGMLLDMGVRVVTRKAVGKRGEPAVEIDYFTDVDPVADELAAIEWSERSIG